MSFACAEPASATHRPNASLQNNALELHSGRAALSTARPAQSRQGVGRDKLTLCWMLAATTAAANWIAKAPRWRWMGNGGRARSPSATSVPATALASAHPTHELDRLPRCNRFSAEARSSWPPPNLASEGPCSSMSTPLGVSSSRKGSPQALSRSGNPWESRLGFGPSQGSRCHRHAH